MKYLHIQWMHDLPDAPTDVYAELDDDRMEIRKIEMFGDGSIGYALLGLSTESTSLRSSPVPYVSQLNQDPKAMARDLEWHEFDDLWDKVVKPRL